MIGKKILSYEIVSLLGEGGMGNVYLAIHTQLGRKVAIKSLLPQLVKHEQIRERFKQEASTMARLQHPNIVSLIDYVEDSDGAYLIMEYVEGKELDAYIKTVSGPMPQAIVVPIMTQILEAFAYAHENGVIHRDIKPSNILFATDGKIKIMDFGIAKLLSDADKKLTKTGLQMGTVYFMSPEQVKGKAVDKRSDIYALGVTFFQMITGHSPYESLTTEYEVYNRIVNDPLPSVNSIYPGAFSGFDGVIAKATAKAPEDRFDDCRAFLTVLNGPLSSQQPEKEKIDKDTMGHAAVTPPDTKKSNVGRLIFILSGAAVILTIFTWQCTVQTQYKNLLADAEDSYDAGNYSGAIQKYEQARRKSKQVFWTGSDVDLSAKLNDANYAYYKDVGDTRLREDSFSLSSSRILNPRIVEAFEKAKQYHLYDDDINKRITLCDKIQTAMNKYDSSQYSASESAYRAAISYARQISIDSIVINHLRKAMNAVTSPRIDFTRIWVDHSTYQGEEKGMLIHVSFDAYFMKDKNCTLAIWFFTDAGEKVQSENSLYKASDGQLAVYDNFSPTFRESSFGDMKVFMPYSGLSMTQSGSYKFKAGIFIGNTQIGGDSDYTSFTLTLNNSPVDSAAAKF